MISASTHGASGFEEFFIGSNAFKIISATPSPVITVRKTVPEKIRRIVVPLKLHVDTRQKVLHACDLATLFGAEIHLVTIACTSNKKDNNRLNSYLLQSADYLRKRHVKFTTKKLQGESLVNLINNYVEAVDADMVAIMTSQAGNFGVLLGSYAHQMLYRSKVPVLSITAKEKRVPAGFTTQGRYK